MKLSQKIQAMELSPIRKFVPYADAAVAAGKKVYRLNLGQPDIKTPKAFFDTVKNFDQEVLAYANSQGEASLLEALVGYYKRIGLDFQKKDLLITNGGSEAINMLMTAILDNDDEVIMAEPFYTNYKTFVGQAGGKVVAIPTTAEDGYQYAVREKKNGRQRLILTCLEEKVKMYLKFGLTDRGIANSTWGGEEWHEMVYSLDAL